MRRYLRQIEIDRFGGLSERAVGPFGPGMNVVFGSNEAGKSTLASAIRGVMFGWEDARGVKNRYRPASGGRRVRLEWDVIPERSTHDPDQPTATDAGDSDDDTSAGELYLVRDEQVAQGDRGLVEDIDRETFDALFSMSADELRSLRGSSNVAARLLTAGTGTQTIPASALAEVEHRITATETDIRVLEEHIEDKRSQIKQQAERERLLVQEDRELHELALSRAGITERIDALNQEIEDLISWHAELDGLDRRARLRENDLSEISSELEETEGEQGADVFESPLLALDSTGERMLYGRLDEYDERREKLERAAEAAKENAATSSAAYEALMELTEEEVAASRSLRNRTSQAVVSVLLPVAFISAGIPLFVHGREISSLSITALGVGLVVIAIMLAAAAFFVLFRAPREGGRLESKQQDARWVMLQDQKKLDACMQNLDEFAEELKGFLDEAGLSPDGAIGSIRQARSLLDEASERRSELAAHRQRRQSVELRARAVERELAEIAVSRSQIAEQLSTLVDLSATALPLAATVPPTTAIPSAVDKLTARSLDGPLRERTAQRDALIAAVDEMAHRIGELEAVLSSAREDHMFDQMKIEYHELLARLRERKHELVVLLLAKRMLGRSITAWEGYGQPEVYAQAGQLLKTITDGAWVAVSSSATGSLTAMRSDGVMFDTRHLSLGTCQQLYLALRMALLLVAHDVGTDVPVLADNVLVNFDASRRMGAARAFEELAQHRQVIMFTCHREVAALFADFADAVLVDLDAGSVSAVRAG